jgi:hypothetical protein
MSAPTTVGGLAILKRNLAAYAKAYKTLQAGVKEKAPTVITHCDVETVSIDGSVRLERYSEFGNPPKKQKTAAVSSSGTPALPRTGTSLLKSKTFGAWAKVTADVGGRSNVIKLCEQLLLEQPKENHEQALMWHVFKSFNDLERESIVTGTTAAIFDTFKNYKIFLEDAKSRLSQEPASSADEEDDGDEEESGP